MSVFIGSTEISNSYVGVEPVAGIYLGTEKVWPNKAFYRDDFSYSDNSGLGPNWVPGARIMRDFSSKYAAPGNLANGTSNENGTFFASYTGGGNAGRMNTDDISIKAQLFPSTRNGRGSNDAQSAIYMSLSDTGLGVDGRNVGLVFTRGNTSAIFTYENGPGTARVIGGPNIPNNSIIEFRRTGNVYGAYLNNSSTPYMSWTDSAGYIPLGQANKRRWGIGTMANVNIFGTQYDSAWFDWIEAKDL